MSEWVSRLGVGLLFTGEKVKADFHQFVEEINNENVEFLSCRKEFDEVKETKPSYEQLSEERILDEANKNIQVLKSLETILQDRTQSYNTFFTAQGKNKTSFEIFQYCQGSLRQALDALFVFLEQELQQARQQNTLGDLRRALSEVKVDAQKKLTDYQREVNNSERDVAVAERKLAKSKESLERFLEHRHRLESGDIDRSATTPGKLTMPRYNNRGDINKQERLRECSEGIAKCDKEIREDVRYLLRALGERDQVLKASRRAYQKIDKECKKAVAVTFRKLIIREREAAMARESVLLKLESAVDDIDVDLDVEDFIIHHRQDDADSLQSCSQALTVLEDLMEHNSHELFYHNAPHSQSRSSSIESDSNRDGDSAIDNEVNFVSLSERKDDIYRKEAENQSKHIKKKESQIISYTPSPYHPNNNKDNELYRSYSPTPVSEPVSASATLSYAVTTGINSGLKKYIYVYIYRYIYTCIYKCAYI